MRCLTKTLMLVCAGLSLSSCAHVRPPSDSYCELYSPVVVQKGDGAISASSGVKKRLLANELTFRKLCPK